MSPKYMATQLLLVREELENLENQKEVKLYVERRYALAESKLNRQAR